MAWQKGKSIRQLLAFLLCLTLSLGTLAGCADRDAILVGVTSQIHEQIIGWMIRELAARDGIECQIRETGPGIANVQPALENNSLQIGIEFSQSAWRNVLQKKKSYAAGDLAELQSAYKKRGLYWYSLPMVEDHYSLAISRTLAKQTGVETLSDLAGIADTLTLGAATSFFQEAEGYPLLNSVYGISFQTTKNLASDGLVSGVLNGKVDVIPAHSLDGEIAGTEFVLLEDDLQMHDDTTAGIVITKDALMEHPQLAEMAQDIARVLKGKQLAHYANAVVKGDCTAQEAALQLLKVKDLITEKQD